MTLNEANFVFMCVFHSIIISSIGTYNYEVAKYLCSLLQPYIPTNYCTQDSFSFVNEIQDIPLSGNFVVSFDVES